ncbi:hypothetical protein HPB49_025292 [Dermacentor silvarum]|uniref:Uncharacterized protein n=1 Tax=Dermacentor silvarum TaxID=543639 RepID=A0ACB8D8N8_DERSI|nr:hypothetical protein HPB49_025292 [Dermacentor silvarum]
MSVTCDYAGGRGILMKREERPHHLDSVYTGTMAASLLNPAVLQDLALSWLREDQPSLDVGLYVVGDADCTAYLWCKSPGVLAGVPFANAVLSQLDCDVKWLRNEGEWLHPVAKVAEVTGQARRVLLAERVVLNCLARASGVASAARRMREVLNGMHWDGVLAGTRKTTPGFRLVENLTIIWPSMTNPLVWSLRCFCAFLCVFTCVHGSLMSQAVRIAKKMGGFTRKVEVECRSVEEAQQAARAGGDIIMLDNFEAKDLSQAAQKLKTEFPGVLIEASGGITPENVTQYAVPGIDIISSSLLIQGYPTVDFSLKLQPPKKPEC